jgi:hypothetical protein
MVVARYTQKAASTLFFIIAGSSKNVQVPAFGKAREGCFAAVAL